MPPLSLSAVFKYAVDLSFFYLSVLYVYLSVRPFVSACKKKKLEDLKEFDLAGFIWPWISNE